MTDPVMQFLHDLEQVQNHIHPGIQLVSFLDEGGQGIVYKGVFQGIDVAVKIYFPEQIQTRIEREIDALASLENSHVVNMLWSGSIPFGDSALTVVVTEFIEGTVLSRHIGYSGALGTNSVARIIHDISDAIAAMWEKRIVHRDLKPPNIMLRTDGSACVIDLGIGRHIARTPLTATGFTWGTQGYMSPEQTQAVRLLSCKSDIYSLGVIALECLLGYHPTRGSQMALIQTDFSQHLPIQVQAVEYADLLSRMLEHKPHKRPLPAEIISALSLL